LKLPADNIAVQYCYGILLIIELAPSTENYNDEYC